VETTPSTFMLKMTTITSIISHGHLNLDVLFKNKERNSLVVRSLVSCKFFNSSTFLNFFSSIGCVVFVALVIGAIIFFKKRQGGGGGSSSKQTNNVEMKNTGRSTVEISREKPRSEED
jgi:hypothetical protein